MRKQSQVYIIFTFFTYGVRGGGIRLKCKKLYIFSCKVEAQLVHLSLICLSVHLKTEYTCIYMYLHVFTCVCMHLHVFTSAITKIRTLFKVAVSATIKPETQSGLLSNESSGSLLSNDVPGYEIWT